MYQLMSGPKKQGVDRAGRPVVITHRCACGRDMMLRCRAVEVWLLGYALQIFHRQHAT